MGRPYAGAAGTHMFFGLLSMAAGVAWICLFQFYDQLLIDGKSLWQTYSPWVTVILSAKLICGFWFLLTGIVGCCIKSRGCTEGVFVAMNVLNVIIWAPVLLLVMAVLVYEFTIGTALIANLVDQQDQLDEQMQQFTQFVWLWVFPAVGLLVGVVEFILSIVSYSIVCCCRPDSLDDGFDYQYEMK